MLIGMAGRPAAGKETFVKLLKGKNFNYYETRQILIQELKKQGKETSRANMQNLADELRNKYGAGALMKKLLEQININENNIIDSLRNYGEAEFLKNELGNNFILIAVDAPREIRFKRTLKRNKKSDPMTWKEFIKVDERDNLDKENPMGQQTGKLIKKADFIINNNSSLENLKKECEKVMNNLKLNNNY